MIPQFPQTRVFHSAGFFVPSSPRSRNVNPLVFCSPPVSSRCCFPSTPGKRKTQDAHVGEISRRQAHQIALDDAFEQDGLGPQARVDRPEQESREKGEEEKA